MAKNQSVCQGGQDICFYWHQCSDSHHVSAAVDALMDCIDKQGRHQNIYQEEDNRQMFEERIQLAERGELKPIDHVKRIQSYPNLEMYEIRWEDVQIRRVDPATGLYEDATAVSVRMYYGEQDEAWVIGVHAHEKEFCDEDALTTAAQNEEIRLAAQRLVDGQSSRWNVDELRIMTVLDHGLDSSV